jgi:trimeric autotransporter adhesin
MSTKTTFKRVALVAVAALGFGLLTSVAPASASGSAGTVGTPVVIGGTTNQPVAIRVPVTIAAAATASGESIAVSAVLVARPDGANATNDRTVFDAARAATATAVGDGRTVTTTEPTYSTNPATTNTVNYAVSGSVSGTARALSLTSTYTFTPTVAGTYQVAIFTDGGANVAGTGLIKAGDSIQYVTVTVADAPAVSTRLTVIAPGTFEVSGTNGAVVRVSALDAAGNVAKLNAGQMVTLTIPSGLTLTTISGTSQTTGLTRTNTQYGLVAADFDVFGNAYLNVTSAAAATYNLQSKIAGGTDAVATAPLTFNTKTANATAGGTVTNADTTTQATPRGFVTGGVMTGVGAINVSSSATSHTYRVYAAAADAAARVAITLNDAGSNLWSPVHALSQDVVVTLAAAPTAASTNGTSTTVTSGTYSIPVTLALGGVTGTAASAFVVTPENSSNNSDLALTLSGVASIAASSGGTLTRLLPSAASIRAVAGSVTTIQLECRDNFGAVRANIVLTPTIAGRNAALVLPTLVTNASGLASFSYTDASTSTTSLTDTVSIAGCTTGATLTVNYTSVAGFGATSVKMTSPNMTVAGTANTVVAPQPISAGAAGPSAVTVPVTATVTDVNGAAISGVPVTFTVAGSGVAVPSNAVVAYTSATGVATSSVYAWTAGTYTVTATVGTVTGTSTVTFASTTATNARTISATVSGNIVTGKATDRFGNPVSGATLYATVVSGDGYFGLSGLKTANTLTLADGTATFVVTGTGAEVRVSNINPADPAGTEVGQTSAPKGYVTNAATNTATVGIFTASKAGDAVTAETGVGASFDAAGVASATVTVAADAAAAQSQAAADAAAEATDAANAATDAANAAAEAADAATAAAQDAADAVAALATSVEAMVNALKRQITSLTNLVIKIQKKVRA